MIRGAGGADTGRPPPVRLKGRSAPSWRPFCPSHWLSPAPRLAASPVWVWGWLWAADSLDAMTWPFVVNLQVGHKHLLERSTQAR